jgi:hypothetical protein
MPDAVIVAPEDNYLIDIPGWSYWRFPEKGLYVRKYGSWYSGVAELTLHGCNIFNATESIKTLDEKYIPVDTTLTQVGVPADAKTVGDRLKNVMGFNIASVGVEHSIEGDKVYFETGLSLKDKVYLATIQFANNQQYSFLIADGSTASAIAHHASGINNDTYIIFDLFMKDNTQLGLGAYSMPSHQEVAAQLASAYQPMLHLYDLTPIQ